MRECECSSGLPYESCCGRYIAGQEVPDATSLMRSRYTAFAITTKRGDYIKLHADAYKHLHRTLHSSQPEAKLPFGQVRAFLEKHTKSARYHGLEILDADGPDESGDSRVLFIVQMYKAGVDASFVELSSFRREDGQLRYVTGLLLPAKQFRPLNVTKIAELVTMIDQG